MSLETMIEDVIERLEVIDSDLDFDEIYSDMGEVGSEALQCYKLARESLNSTIDHFQLVFRPKDKS